MGHLTEARQALEDLIPALDRFDSRLTGLSQTPTDSAARATVPNPYSGGEGFRVLEELPSRWADEYSYHENLPLGAVLWRGSERIAWTVGAEPLAFLPDPIPRDRTGSVTEAWFKTAAAGS